MAPSSPKQTAVHPAHGRASAAALEGAAPHEEADSDGAGPSAVVPGEEDGAAEAEMEEEELDEDEIAEGYGRSCSTFLTPLLCSLARGRTRSG